MKSADNTLKNNNENSGILLLSKQSGETSFASLSAVKKSLGTKKVGHTGTLDSFADGLLVVMTGHLTRLVSHITNFDKTYLALVEFCTQTDTLDPTGTVVSTGAVPMEAQVRLALQKFKGEIDQVPPEFSALHVNGKRASELMRSGEKVELPARKITIYSITLLDFFEKYALIEVHCSKGTYIRSLARDIAKECGTVAHLKALRRTSVGPFLLKNAAGCEQLPDFTMSSLLKAEKNNFADRKNDPFFAEKIKKCVYPMTFEIAKLCGFSSVILSDAYCQDFASGRFLRKNSFYYQLNDEKLDKETLSEEKPETKELAVFYPDLAFAGIVKKEGRKFSYGFVIPPKKEKIKIFSWEQIVNSKFSKEFFEQGTALSIGSFDGTHIGHDAIFNSILAKKDFVPGIVTFRHSTRLEKAGNEFNGEVQTLSQRLEFFMDKGFSFVVVIDFSDDFTKIDGYDFLSVLKKNCNVKYLAEGEDFRCGYKGSTDIQAIESFCQKNDVELNVVTSVEYLDKKVSSSRIRQDVLDKKFEEIKIMLKSPFTIDCAGFTWKKETIDGQNYLTAKKCGIQIFPPDGEYTVDVTMVISGSEEISVAKAVACKLNSGLLRVLDFDGSLRGFVRAIQFGYPEK